MRNPLQAYKLSNASRYNSRGRTSSDKMSRRGGFYRNREKTSIGDFAEEVRRFVSATLFEAGPLAASGYKQSTRHERRLVICPSDHR